MDAVTILRQVAISAVPILIAITFHEAAHGYAAYRMGDATAKASGRLTLNPLAHIDPIGTVLIPVMLLVLTKGQFVFGYAKPVPINPYNFRNPRRDMALSAAAGPGTNFTLAVLCILLIRLVVAPLSEFVPAIRDTVLAPLYLMLSSGVVINVILGLFNLIPVPPLDGGRVAVGFLPLKQAEALHRLEPYGIMIVLVLIYFFNIGVIFRPVVRFFLSFI